MLPTTYDPDPIDYGTAFENIGRYVGNVFPDTGPLRRSIAERGLIPTYYDVKDYAIGRLGEEISNRIVEPISRVIGSGNALEFAGEGLVARGQGELDVAKGSWEAVFGPIPRFAKGVARGERARPPDAAARMGVDRLGIDPSVQSDSSIDALAAQLEANLQALRDARDKAIRRNGARAAAPYNRAIARLESELSRLRLGRQQVDELFAGIQDRTGRVYDAAVSNLEELQKTSTDEINRIGEEALSIQQQTFSSAAKDVVSFAEKIGMSEQSAAAVASGIEALEDRIMSDTSGEFEDRKAVQKASSAVAVAAAKLSKATSAADLARQQVQIQLKIDDQINQILARKKELEAARRAAVSRARQATIEQFGNFMPKGQSEYALTFVNQFVMNEGLARGLREDEIQDILELAKSTYSSGMISSYPDARRIVGALFAAAEQESGVNVDYSQVTTYADIIWAGFNVWNDANERYGVLRNANPEVLRPNTLDRYEALYSQITAQNPMITPEEADAYARNPQNHAVWRTLGGVITYGGNP